MTFTNIEEAAQHLIETDPVFKLEEVNIRGVRLKVFANAPRHIGELLNLCDQYGDTEFIVFEGERFTFNDFKSQVHRLSNAIKDNFNVSKGDRVAICMRNYPEYLTAILAIASLGAVAVYMNSWWTTGELEYGFSDSGAKLAFVDESIAIRIDPLIGNLDLTLIHVRTNTSAGHAYDLILSQASHEPLQDAFINSDEDMAIMYTSGSTGKPKGVVQTHRGAISAVMSWLMSGRIAELMDIIPDMPKDPDGIDLQPSLLVTTPLFHVSATHACFLLGLAAGAKLVMMPKWNPETAIDLIERENITRFFGVPTMSADILDTAQRMGKTLSSLRTIDAGGAKRPASQVSQLADAFPKAQPRSGFGLTETNGLGLGIGGADYVERPGAAGHLYPPLQTMRIVDDHDHEVPTGEVGELALKSAANMRCYLNKPEATAETLRDGWLYTGDLAVVNSEGIVTIVDRKKDIIIRGGENISCLDVDAALHLHPAIAEAAVFSMPHERLGETVGAGVKLHPNQSLTEQGLQEFLRPHLAPFKIPENIWFVNALPRGGTEKIDRRALRSKCLEETTTHTF